MEILDDARKVFGMPSLKAIKIEKEREESDEEEEEEQRVKENQRVMWDQAEIEALCNLFEGHMASFKGKKPPVGFISTILRDKKETEGKLLIKKRTNSEKNTGQYLSIIETTLMDEPVLRWRRIK